MDELDRQRREVVSQQLLRLFASSRKPSAVDRKAGDSDAPPDIRPVIIEKPPPPPPWFLKNLHFNDKLIYIKSLRTVRN